MAEKGSLVQWNDERGFGFIEDDRGQRHFVHISAIDGRAARPRAGDSVSFVPGLGPDGRAQAKSVRLLATNSADTRHANTRPTRNGSEWRFSAALVLMACLAFGAWVQRVPGILLLGYAGMSLVSFLAYRSDKAFARARQWRVSEVTLLGFDLCLGIIGGLLGQAIFRHKTQKSSFVVATLLIFSVHLLWLTCIAAGVIDAVYVVSELSLALGFSG